MTIKSIVVDDERLARAELKRLLTQHKIIEVIAEASNIKEAMRLIVDSKPQLVFLDLEMPGGTGIHLAEHLTLLAAADRPNIIFCTAYNEFAVDAFTLNAVDYLLKPVNPTRLDMCIKKIAKLVDKDPNVNVDMLDDSFKILVKFHDDEKIIALSDIYRFESIGNHAALHTKFGKAFLQSSLNKIESRLCGKTYFRASRSDIIRLDAIQKIDVNESGGKVATLLNEQLVDISRRQASKLKLLFNPTKQLSQQK